MKIGMLLEELINISNVSKTDFALSMNMTPSGLSKILTGNRLPLLREKNIFSSEAAAYFTEKIFSPGCYLKFKDIFPIIYDFHFKSELEIFLICAIDYALERDFAVANNLNIDGNDQGKSLFGKREVLNMLCVLFSDAVRDDDSFPLTLYGNLPLYDSIYSEIFPRIKLVSPLKQKGITFNYFSSESDFESALETRHLEPVSTVIYAQQYFDLTLWRLNQTIDTAFLLLKGRFLLLFHHPIEAIPLLTIISQKTYMTIFLNTLMKAQPTKISYTPDSVVSLLKHDPAYIDRLIQTPFDTVYNFMSIGYLLERDELDSLEGDACTKDDIYKLYHHVLTSETTFAVTIDAMTNFYTTGKAVVPLLGAVDFPPEERLHYLHRFDALMCDEASDKIKVLNLKFPNAVILCSEEFTIVYLTDDEFEPEKLHYFRTSVISKLLKKELIGNDMKLLSFSPDLWDTYLDELSRSSRSLVLS
ncbi:hypothetical protein [Novisyntrophococcus fermenticellae]|uniref:hypothetical protein n=1 Tax=Novisyntrophococcus fermenticellae TaxID=2068655 RepID=UPI001E3D4F93|nr:hypothetical protein [Novisyntrophococcus fermenticellae]